MAAAAPAHGELGRARRLPAPPLWLTGLLVLALHGAFALATGPMTAPDSVTYGNFGRKLVDSGFDFVTVLQQAQATFPPILYALFVTLVALLRVPFGADWPQALLVVNLLADVALGLLIVRLVRRTTGSPVAEWGALLLFLACFDLFHWVPFALSDTTFVLIAFSIFTLAAARILGDARGWGGVLGLAAVGVFYRPTGMVLLPDLAWAAWLARGGKVAIRRLWLILGFVAAVIGGAFAFAWFMQDPGRWPLETLARAFEMTATGYAQGEVVSARPETYHAPPSQLADYVLISADRFIHFFALGGADFSLAHWAVQLVFFLPCYGLAGWLLVALARGDTAFAPPVRKVFLASAGAILAYALFHGLVQVDYDWRYRVPVIPHFIMLAAGGLADLARRAGLR